VVGGPSGTECFDSSGNPVRATVNYPVVEQAIGATVGREVVAGATPSVRTCGDYVDNIGHLTPNAALAVGLSVAQFYGSGSSVTATPSPSPTPTSTPSPSPTPSQIGRASCRERV